MRRIGLALAMLLVAQALGATASQNETTIALPTSLPTTERDKTGFYTLQYKGIGDANASEHMLEIVHTSRHTENRTAIMKFSAPSASWTLDAWDHVFTTLESVIASLTPDLRHLELNVKFEEPVNVTVLTLALPKPWSYGPTFVFNKHSLAGLSQLQELEFVNMNVSLDDISWLPSPASLSKLVFDGCDLPAFYLNTTVGIQNAVFRKNGLDLFPIYLLHTQPPLESLTLTDNRFSLPTALTTEEFERLQAIPDFVSSGNEFKGSANGTCEHPTSYRGISICIADLTVRSPDTMQKILNDETLVRGRSAAPAHLSTGHGVLVVAGCLAALRAVQALQGGRDGS